MIRPRNVLYFVFGMISMWNFMRTTYVFGGAWSFYVLDAVILLLNLAIATVATGLIEGKKAQ